MNTIDAAARNSRSLRSFVLLIVAIALVSVIASVMANSQPDSRLEVKPAACVPFDGAGRALAALQPIELPYSHWIDPGNTAERLQCRFDVLLAPGTREDAAILILSFGDAITVRMNGRRVEHTANNEMRTLRWVAMPALTRLDPDLWRPGATRLEITVTARGHPPQLDRVFIGSFTELRATYQPRWFAAAVLPTLLCGAELAFSIVFALIWAGRRHETAYGWLAVVLFGGTLHGSVLIPDFGLSDGVSNVWNLTVVWESIAVVLFVRAIANLSSRQRDWLLAVPPTLLCIAAAVVTPQQMNGIVLPAGATLVLCSLFYSVLVLVRAGRDGNRDALIILIGILVLFGFIAREVLMLFGLIAPGAFIGRIGLAGFMITISTMMTLRFVQAMHERDQTADDLRKRVAAAETELRDTYEELRLRREAEAVERERARLMRDLHDGVGGELTSMLALADSPQPSAAEIAGHARAALSDMRLIISSLEDYGGDLAVALAAWRERAEPQVRAARLRLEWNVGDLPIMPSLGPTQVLDILRIVQEAVTNVTKHARATRITLDAWTDDVFVRIAVRDDGMGLRDEVFGNGLRNMAKRAERLGAELEIDRIGDETQILLRLARSQAPQVIASAVDSDHTFLG